MLRAIFKTLREVDLDIRTAPGGGGWPTSQQSGDGRGEWGGRPLSRQLSPLFVWFDNPQPHHSPTRSSFPTSCNFLSKMHMFVSHCLLKTVSFAFPFLNKTASSADHPLSLQCHATSALVPQDVMYRRCGDEPAAFSPYRLRPDPPPFPTLPLREGGGVAKTLLSHPDPPPGPPPACTSPSKPSTASPRSGCSPSPRPLSGPLTPEPPTPFSFQTFDMLAGWGYPLTVSRGVLPTPEVFVQKKSIC